MSTKHSVLIVEDDPETATDLTQVAVAMGCDTTQTDNQRDALILLDERRFCAVLLDLEIREQSKSIKGHKVFGTKLIHEVRTRYGGHRGSSFWTPIVVVTAHAKEVDAVVRMMKEGADDIIPKPLDLADVEARIRSALASAGRPTHEACTAAASRAADKASVVLRITGQLERQRAVITLANRSIALTTSALTVLLHLAIARQKGQMVSKGVLGAKPHEGFRPISRLREQLRPSGRYADIVANDRRGGYALKGEVTVAECNVQGLKGLKNKEIDGLAATLAGLLAEPNAALGRRL